MSGSPVIFISHISRERSIAIALRKALESLFSNAEVFVSNPAIVGGKSWFDTIREALTRSDIIIVSVSKDTQLNPWITFEAGAGLEKLKSVPVIWGKMTFDDLEPPLSALQGRKIDDRQSFTQLLNDVTTLANHQRAPWNDEVFDTLLLEIQEFEKSLLGDGGTEPDNSLDKESLEKWDRLSELAGKLVDGRLDQLRDNYPDIPALETLRDMKFHEAIDIASAVNAFTPMEMLTLTSIPIICKIPEENSSTFTKKAAIKTLDDQYSRVQKIAKKYNTTS